MQRDIYNTLKKALSAYSPPFIVREGKNVSGKDSYDLYAIGDFIAYGRKRSEVFFASVIMQKAYVGFYFMPIYTEPEAMKNVFSPRLLKCLKGKSCFYIKQLDDELLADIEQALQAGLKLYKQRGWV